MINFSVRPRIRCVTPMEQREIYARFNDFLAHTDKPIQGRTFRDHIELRVRPEHRHYWSPVLNIILDDVDEGTSVRGRFGPEPKVWTLFMFFYFFALAISFFAGMYGLVQLKMGYPAWSFWLVLLGLGLLLLIYIAAQIGQKKGAEQTQWLMSFCTEVLKHEE